MRGFVTAVRQRCLDGIRKAAGRIRLDSDQLVIRVCGSAAAREQQTEERERRERQRQWDVVDKALRGLQLPRAVLA